MTTEAHARDDLGRFVGATVAGKYRIERLLGRGGMGAVFAAQNTAIGKRVALKFLSAEAARDRDAARRFQREAQAASMIESEHIVQVFDSGTTDDGLPFLVMEHLSGEDLRAKLTRERELGVSEAVAIALQVLRALVRAHAAGIIHRDLKPDNVFLCARDDGSMLVKLVDFGISKLERGTMSERLTRRGTVLGSAHYMSPEQAQASDDVDQRSDLYGVGAMLFEMLAGRPPHVGTTLESVLVAICTQTAPSIQSFRPDVGRELSEAVARALEREPSARFATAAAMRDALEAVGPDGARRARRGPSRTLVAGVLATLIGFTATAVLIASRAHPPTAPAEATTALLAPVTLTPSPAPVVAPIMAETPTPVPAPASAPATRAATPGSATPSAAARSARGSPKTPATSKRRPTAAGTEPGVAASLKLSTREP